MRFLTVAIAGLLVVAGVLAPFAVQGGDTRVAAVPMEDTRSTGAPESVVVRAHESSLVLPKGQVFFTQYRYAVGYYGVASLVSGLQANTERELGRPMAVYVSDFSGTDLSVGDDGLLRMSTDREHGWVAAADAYFVVGSDARTPTRDRAVVPFSERADAAAFADDHGGRVERWAAVAELSFGAAGRTPAEWERVEDRRREASDGTVERATRLLDRPVSATVGANDSLAAAVRDAPPNTTVRLAAGNHSVRDVRVEKPVTIRGAGANLTRVAGDGNGSVFDVNASRVALADLSVSGVGPVRSRDPANVTAVPVGNESFRHDYWTTHGYGDAGVVFDESAASLVSDVRVTTDANGVIARNSPNLSVSNLTVVGTEDWEDGFLGVAVLGAPAVVENSTFYGGKVGVWAHDTDSFAVRNTSMEGMMVGVFSVYAQGAFAADNDIRDTWVGVYVHDRSNGNVVTGNDIENSRNGVLVYGRSSYVADNVLTHNRNGLAVQGQFAVYRRNVLAFNRVGVRVMSLFPTNDVTANDVAYNQRYAETTRYNVLHVWNGNYWRGAPGVDADGDGYLSRPFSATGPVGAVAERGAGAPTLARAPALQMLQQLQRTVPGLRAGGVADERPSAEPIRPAVLERLAETRRGPGRYEDDDDWDYDP
ncbi:nitrous oxide reductase accessory protein NosL [Halobacterium sp. R2-5]|uniref:nitrous oxide reductase accessory protein NosL n=1 Tax=Halobacterium sp. R2-5 TaxID=2715751 RepID=UPI0014208692|nr:nitrous oxide reductase accessory protein NosL [Halobacterium sp. R2-5]NIB99188.1 copper-binding protein [Halobacterium sp. R2-5]